MLKFNKYPNIVGASVPKFAVTVGGNERAINRNVLREVWNTNFTKNNQCNTRAIGGFRAVMNAGDLKSRKNYGCGGSNKVTSRPGMMVLTTRDGVNRCKGDGVEAANTNVKWVYDSSDFTRYRKESSINSGYAGNRACTRSASNVTDYSYGGSGVPVGRGRQARANGMASYGSVY